MYILKNDKTIPNFRTHWFSKALFNLNTISNLKSSQKQDEPIR